MLKGIERVKAEAISTKFAFKKKEPEPLFSILKGPYEVAKPVLNVACFDKELTYTLY
jgi:tellurite resistance protein